MDEFFNTLIQFGTVGFVTLVMLVLFMVIGSATPIGRAMLPESVTDVVTKLLPRTWIADVVATDDGRFELQVQGASRLKTVHVHHREDFTIACTYDTEQQCPQAGSYSFSEFRHNLRPGAASEPMPDMVRERIDSALRETLAAKQFLPIGGDTSDVLVSVFVAIEDEVPVDSLTDSFDRNNNAEWKAAVTTAMRHDGVQNPATIANGSILLDIIDSHSMQVLWRSAAIGKIVVDVTDLERERRIWLTVSEMLKAFPPKLLSRVTA